MTEKEKEKNDQVNPDTERGYLIEKIEILAHANQRLEKLNREAANIINQSDRLRGPDFVNQTERSDGMVFAVPRDQHRKNWIRTFGAYALPGTIARVPVGSGSTFEQVAEDVRAQAVAVWNEFEAYFEGEKIVETAAAKVADELVEY
jgi:hypothetical protein